jgi:hypothetical protein
MPWYSIDYRPTDKKTNREAAIGFCFEVQAEDKAAALTKLRESNALPEEMIQCWDPDDSDGIDTRVYFYPELLTEDDLQELDRDPREDELTDPIDPTKPHVKGCPRSVVEAAECLCNADRTALREEQ